MSKDAVFTREADLVACFCDTIRQARSPKWRPYHETAGWDLLLVHESGVQIGIEAKLSLNAKVLEQALPGYWPGETGPDYRAVLVERCGLQNHLQTIAHHLGIVVIVLGARRRANGKIEHAYINPGLPDDDLGYSAAQWPNWCPSQRCQLPDYVPDVVGGHASPVQLTAWKIAAIKLLITLDRRGFVTRRDMKALRLSPSRWTDNYHGFLSASPIGYVRNGRTPDLRAQHPVNYAEIEAGIATWSAGLEPLERAPDLLGSAA